MSRGNLIIQSIKACEGLATYSLQIHKLALAYEPEPVLILPIYYGHMTCHCMILCSGIALGADVEIINFLAQR